jgi:hypothetical protein
VAGIEPMGVGADLVARKLNPVAARRSGSLDRLVEQDGADPLVAVPGGDVHRLDLGATPSSVLEMAEDQDLADPDHLVGQRCDEHRAGLAGSDLDQRIPIRLVIAGVLFRREAAAGDDPGERRGVIRNGVAYAHGRTRLILRHRRSLSQATGPLGGFKPRFYRRGGVLRAAAVYQSE